MPARPTYQTIADEAGVAKSTVSLALRDHPRIPEATRERIRAIAARLGYCPHPHVTTLMTRVRASGGIEYHETLALIDARGPGDNRSDVVQRRHAQGIEARAAAVGYRVERHRLREPGMSGRRLSDILSARGIRGLLIPPIPHSSGHLSLDWARFACATMGYSLRRPELHRACHANFQAMRLTLRHLRHAQYRRIGLAMSADADRRVDGYWTAAFLMHEETLPKSQRVPLLRTRIWSRETFARWHARHRPDAVVSVGVEALGWLRDLGARVPEDCGYATVYWEEYMGECSGIDQGFEHIGAAAVDLVVGQLQRNELGLPANPKETLLLGRWRDGGTLRRVEA